MTKSCIITSKAALQWWKVSCPDYIHYFNLGFYWDALNFTLDCKVNMTYANEKILKIFFFSNSLPTLHSITLQHLTTPPLLLCLLPHTGPLHQGGGGARGIHGLKEIIIDWCGPGCWFSWTAAPRGLTERKKDSHHWLSFTFSSSWHICKAHSLVSFTFLICLSQDCLSYPLCAFFFEYLPLTYIICQSTWEEGQRASDLISLITEHN